MHNKWLRRAAMLLLPAALMSCDAARLAADLPKDQNVLFWSQSQRDTAFRQLELIAPHGVMKAGDTALALTAGAPLKTGFDFAAYMAAQRNSGLIIVHDGKVRFESYGLDTSASARWTSFSVAKSFTSTLVGAAIKDGAIKSLDDKVSAYIPDLKGSAYDDVTVEQLLTMTSGVRWNEDYADPKSDVARFTAHKPDPGVDVTVSYMRKLPREAAPGTKWVYKTGETNLIGVLVSSATKTPLSAYLTRKVWSRTMADDGIWLRGSTGHEISGCCISATLRDYARFGMFLLGDTSAVLPPDWLAKATAKHADIGTPGKGYGYQWWTYDDGTYAAQGIFGQGIFIDPVRKLVIASNGNWPKATDEAIAAQREAMYRAVQAAVDAG